MNDRRFVYSVTSWSPDPATFYYGDEGAALRAGMRSAIEAVGRESGSLYCPVWTDDRAEFRARHDDRLLAVVERHPLIG